MDRKAINDQMKFLYRTIFSRKYTFTPTRVDLVGR
jgi:hypothetical protein